MGYLVVVVVVVVDPLKLFKVLKKKKKNELYGQSVLAVIWVDRAAAVISEWEEGRKFTFLSGPVLHAGDPYTCVLSLLRNALLPLFVEEREVTLLVVTGKGCLLLLLQYIVI